MTHAPKQGERRLAFAEEVPRTLRSDVVLTKPVCIQNSCITLPFRTIMPPSNISAKAWRKRDVASGRLNERHSPALSLAHRAKALLALQPIRSSAGLGKHLRCATYSWSRKPPRMMPAPTQQQLLQPWLRTRTQRARLRTCSSYELHEHALFNWQSLMSTNAVGLCCTCGHALCAQNASIDETTITKQQHVPSRHTLTDTACTQLTTAQSATDASYYQALSRESSLSRLSPHCLFRVCRLGLSRPSSDRLPRLSSHCHRHNASIVSMRP